MRKYLEVVRLASGETVLRLASDEEVGKKRGAIKQEKEEAHRRNVLAGGLKLRRANNSQAIKEERARLKNRSFTAEERTKHEERLQSLEAEALALQKEEAESIEQLQQARQKWEASDKSFKDTHIPIDVADDDDE